MSTVHEHNSDDLSPETPTSGPPSGAPARGPTGARSGQGDDPVVSIIVVSYNTREMTLECLRSIVRETPDLSYEVLFIDNQSTDGSWEAVREEFNNDPRFTLRLSEKNLGFAGANNEMAKDARGEYILLLNPDTVVLDQAIEKLVSFAESQTHPGIWGGRTYYQNGLLNPGSCWGDYSLWSQFCRYSGLTRAMPRTLLFDPRTYGQWDRDSVRSVAIVTGCLLLIPRGFWRALGGFDPEFFMYGEEADLCLRARALGAVLKITPDATIVHHGGASEPVQEDKVVRLLDGEVRLLRRHWRQWRFRLNLLIVCGGIQWRRLVESLYTRSPHARTWRQVWIRRSEWLRGAKAIG